MVAGLSDENGYAEIHPTRYKDLIPYLPYTIHLETSNCIWLGARSYVDIDEEAFVRGVLVDIARYEGVCLNKRIRFLFQDFVDYLGLQNKPYIDNIDIGDYMQIFDEHKRNYAKYTNSRDEARDICDCISLDRYRMYRKALAKEMLSYGIDPRQYHGLSYVM